MPGQAQLTRLPSRSYTSCRQQQQQHSVGASSECPASFALLSRHNWQPAPASRAAAFALPGIVHSSAVSTVQWRPAPSLVFTHHGHSAQLALLQCVHERAGVDEAATAHVDDDGVRLHGLDAAEGPAGTACAQALGPFSKVAAQQLLLPAGLRFQPDMSTLHTCQTAAILTELTAYWARAPQPPPRTQASLPAI